MVTFLSSPLSNSLFHENSEILLETSRVLGNLTRRSVVIQSLIKTRMDEALLLLYCNMCSQKSFLLLLV